MIVLGLLLEEGFGLLHGIVEFRLMNGGVYGLENRFGARHVDAAMCLNVLGSALTVVELWVRVVGDVMNL